MGLGACSSVPTAEADRAQLADVATTGIGVANGFQEANAFVRPLVTSGPVGLAGFAGIKLGINRLGPRQSPRNCRTLLSASTAAGWGAAMNNAAVMLAPPLAIMAIPVVLHTYYTSWRRSALDACYQGKLNYAVLSVPEKDFRELPPAQDTAISQAVGNWPLVPRIDGARKRDGRVLVQASLITGPRNLRALIERFDLDWDIVGAWNGQGTEVAELRSALLTPHLVAEQTGREQHVNDAPSLRYDPGSGAVTFQIPRHPAWSIAVITPETELRLAKQDQY